MDQDQDQDLQYNVGLVLLKDVSNSKLTWVPPPDRLPGHVGQHLLLAVGRCWRGGHHHLPRLLQLLQRPAQR